MYIKYIRDFSGPDNALISGLHCIYPWLGGEEIDSRLSQEHEGKCKQSCLGFELGSPIPFPTQITVTLSMPSAVLCNSVKTLSCELKRKWVLQSNPHYPTGRWEFETLTGRWPKDIFLLKKIKIK